MKVDRDAGRLRYCAAMPDSKEVSAQRLIPEHHVPADFNEDSCAHENALFTKRSRRAVALPQQGES